MLNLLREIIGMLKELLAAQKAQNELLTEIELQQLEILKDTEQIIKLLTEPDVVGLEVKINPETTH